MYMGDVPLLTKGPLVTFYGGAELLKEVSPGAPGKSLTILLLSSLLFQAVLFIFKWFCARKIRNYTLELKATLVNNVLNIYGLLILITISATACFYVIYHYLSIQNEAVQTGAEGHLMPRGLLLLYLLTAFVVLLPYCQNFALRSDRDIRFLCNNIVCDLRQYTWRKVTSWFPVKKETIKPMRTKNHHSNRNVSISCAGLSRPGEKRKSLSKPCVIDLPQVEI